MHGGRGLELRRRDGLALILAAALAGCAGAPVETRVTPAEPASGRAAPAGDAPAMDSDGAYYERGEAEGEAAEPEGVAIDEADAQGAARPATPGAGGSVGPRRPIAPTIRPVLRPRPREPRVLVPIDFTPRPAEPVRVRLAELTLPPGGTFQPPASPCQDVLVYLREGELAAVGTGIAPPPAPATVYAGDALRFGPEGDGLLSNLGDQPARTVLAYLRADAEPRFDAPAPRTGEACAPASTDDPLVRPIRTASARTTPPLTALGGAMRVRVLLDADGVGARRGGLSALEGDADMVVPAHQHPENAEIVLVLDGSGVMQIGDRTVAVRPGVAIYVPPNVLHDFRGDGTRPLIAIQVYTPSGPEQRYRAR